MGLLNQVPHLVLNVDASETARNAKSRVLSETGYRVMEAGTGEEALLLAASLRPSLIVLDVTLPGMDGLEVCRRIKRDAVTAHMMVLQVSIAGGTELEQAAGREGSADSYLIEPIDPLELVATVRALLRLAERETDTRRLTEQLSRLERQFAEATEAADCGIWDWDIRSGKLEWFGQLERLAGLRPGGFSGKIEGFSDLLHADDRSRVWQKLQDVIDRRQVHFEDEHRYVHPDGSVHWMAAVGRFVYNEEGDAVRMTGVVQDITMRKLAEQRQQLESEGRRLLACAAEQLLGADNPAALMPGIFETVRRHLELDGYIHYRFDQTVGLLLLESCSGMPDEIRTTYTALQLGQSLCGTAAQGSTALVYERLYEASDEKAQVVKTLGFQAYVCHPLMVGDRLLGTLAFASKTRDRFVPDEIAFMQTICRYVAAAMDRLRLEAETRERGERLRLSEEHLRTAMDLNPQIPWTARPDGSVDEINERWLQFSGLTRADALGDAWMRVQHEADVPRVMAAWRQAVHTGESCEVEHRIRAASGDYRWMRSRAFPRRDSTGRIVRWYGTTEDIHDRKLAEEALLESRARLEGALQFREAVMANIKEGLYTLDRDGLVTYVNPAAEALLGWTSEELLGRQMHPVIHHMHRDGTGFPAEHCAGLHVLHEGTTLVGHADVFIRKDGTVFDVVYSSAPLLTDGRITGLVLVFRDVSDKLKAEQALRDSEKRFRMMAQAVPSFLFETDAEGWNIWTSDGWCQFTGQTQAEVRGHGWANALHPDDRAANIDRWTACMRDGVPFESRQRLRRHDGYYAWVMAKALPVRNERGTIDRWLGSVTDVDELTRGEEALRESEERFRQIAETTDYVFWMTALNPERVLYVSPAYEGIWQRPASALYRNAREWSDAICPEDREAAIHAYERWMADPDGAGFDVEYRIVRPDGSVRWIADRGHDIRDAAGRVYRLTGIARDITAMKESEVILRQGEERLRLALDASLAGTWSWDVATKQSMWDERYHHLYGFEAQEPCSFEAWIGRVHPADRGRLLARVQSLLTATGDDDWSEEFRALHPVKGERWMQGLGRVERDETGKAVRFAGINLDITERKWAEERLKEQAHLDAFGARISKHLVESRNLADMLRRCTQTMVDDLDAAFARIWIVNEQDHVLELHASSGLYTNLEGRHARVPVGSLKIGLIAAERTPNLTNQVLGDPRVSDQEWARREGMVAFAGYPLIVEDRVVGVMAMFSRRPLSESTQHAMALVADHIALGITRKQTEEALRRQEEQLRVITDAVPSFIAYVDREERYRFVNAAYEQWFHRPRRDILGRSVKDVLKAGYATVEPFMSRVLNGEPVRFERGIQGGGLERTVLTSYSPDVREDGTVAGFYVLVTDITDQKRHEDELEKRVAERTQELVASQGRLRALASQLTLTEQRERRKLALDLHDYLAQLLVVGRMKMAQIARQPALTPAAQAIVRDGDNLFQQALVYTRTMIADLCPPSLHDAGLPAALQWLEERMQKEGLWVEVCSDRIPMPLPEDQAVLLFYSVRELLFNVLKHAGVDRATVRLTREPEGDVRVAVEDRGRGLDPRDLDRASQPGHLGLFGVRERMESIGGRLEVASTPGTGTVVTLVLPAARARGSV